MNVRLGQGKRPFRNALTLTIGIAMLGLPALRATAQAQTTNRPASKNQPSNLTARRPEPEDFNLSVYYKNKIEFSWEGGWLANNIPFVFDLLVGKQDKLSGLNYTLAPFLASIRWHLTNVRGPGVLRGNWDLTFSGAFTMIPRGPETRYWAYIMGFRRNFVQPNWRIV